MLTEFGATIDRYLVTKSDDDDRDYSYLHPSEFGGCPVSIWLKMTGEKPLVPLGANKIRLFDNGHFLHLRNQVNAKEAGVLAKDKVVSKENVTITIGSEPKSKIAVTGESGRVYHYSAGEIIWRVEKKKSKTDFAIYVGTDLAPYWDTIDHLKEGEEWWLVEVPLVDPIHHFGGHCDAIILNEGKETIIDYKGINDYGMAYEFFDRNNPAQYAQRNPDSFNSSCFICNKNMKKAKELTKHLIDNHLDKVELNLKYKIQLHVYMMTLNLNDGLLWYEDKNNQLVIDFAVERDERLIEKIKSNSLKMWDKIVNKEKPNRPTGSERKKFPCGWCDYSSQCWNN